MAYLIKRKADDIDNVLNMAVAWEDHGGSAVRGMTYEQGVIAAIRWITGDSEDSPIEEGPEEE